MLAAMSGNQDGKKKGDVSGRPFAAMHFRQCKPDANSATACISRSLILEAI
jgi:hypothetical protein